MTVSNRYSIRNDNFMPQIIEYDLGVVILELQPKCR